MREPGRPAAPSGLEIPIPTAPSNDPESWNDFASAGLDDHSIAGWGSPESQHARFVAALSIPVRSGDRLIDFGCGTGAMAEMCPEGVDYHGIDWSSTMIELARSRRPGRTFTVGSLDDIPRAEWIVASGPFNIAAGWSKEETAAALARMWERSSQGIAVTALRVPVKDRLHYGPAEMISYIEGLDWVQAQIDLSYLPHDMCLRAWRDRTD